MIAKKIHYCWFGKSELSIEAKRYIKTWEKKMPDYELVLWNEENFDIESIQYVREAYEAKKFAFVSDYVRLYALFHQGGIYLDTDVEVIKSFDGFLKHSMFLGYEGNKALGTGIIGATKGHPVIKDLLEFYQKKSFVLAKGKLNTIANTKLFSDYAKKKLGWIPKNEFQLLKKDVAIYAFHVFCAKDWRTGEVKNQTDTYTIHHYQASWMDKRKKIIYIIKKIVFRVLKLFMKMDY